MAVLLALFASEATNADERTRATDAVKYFYTLLKEHHCEHIGEYALNYDEARCPHVTIKDYRLITLRDDSESVVAQYHIDAFFDQNDISGDYEVHLVQKKGQWLPDIRSTHKLADLSHPHSQIKWIEMGSDSSEPSHKGRARPTGQDDADSNPPKVEVESSQHSVESPRPNLGAAQSTQPVTKDHPIGPIMISKQSSHKPGDSLLSLWSEVELAGSTADSIIRTLAEPELGPPKSLSVAPVSQKYPHLKALSLRRFKYAGEKKPVALTFDLCEQADEKTAYDSGIVDELRRTRTKATFYAGGKWMQSHQDRTMQLMADPLFEFGNHAWTHGNMRVLTGQAMEHQIDWTQAEYQRLRSELAGKAAGGGLSQLMGNVPEALTTFRFPYGTCSSKSLNALYERSIVPIQWDVVTGDPGGIASPENIIKQTRPGSIVVMHANGRGKGTSRALPEIIRGLKDRGFTFVKISELLDDAQAAPEYAEDCYELRPGDNARYDKLFGDGVSRHKH
jgi:peptidoglycan/xylan/chitin deacetylase (PgdA/CDA1 family)